MKPFQIAIKEYKDIYRMNVSLYQETAETETFLVESRNHQFMFTCNRKSLLAEGKVHLPWTWFVEPANQPKWFINDVCRELEKDLRKK